MKASQLLDNFGDIVLDRLTLNLGTGGEITLTDQDPQLPHGAVVAFRAEARVGAFKVEAEKHIGRVILTIDASSFVIDSVEMPVEPPATEPMLGPDGEVLIGDVVEKLADALSPLNVALGAHLGVGSVVGECPDCRTDDAGAVVWACPVYRTIAAEHGVTEEWPDEPPAETARKKRKAKVEALPTEQVDEG